MTENTEETVARWLAAVIHELVHPMATAQLAVGLATEQLQRAVFALRRASAGADALRWLVRMLLKDETALSACSPCSVLDALSATVHPGITLCIAVHTHLAVLAVPGVLELVLGNLLANARKHAAGTPVTVIARAAQASSLLWPDGAQVHLQGPVVLISVIDSGPGVAEPLRLFEPFATDAIGDGIGLWLCRLAVRAHGGDIWHDKKERGASFTSVWPGVPLLHPALWPDEPLSLGQALRRARAESHLTRAELAQRINVAEATIRNVEVGRHKCSRKFLAAFVSALERQPAGLRFWPPLNKAKETP